MTEGIGKDRHSAAAPLARWFCMLVCAVSISHSAGAATSNTLRSVRPDNGAIAYHPASGSFGYSVDRRSAREAKVEALKQCNNSDCEVVLTLKNSCGALASFKQTFFVSRGATREEAEAKARRQCGVKCEILVWACTK
jgi:hypothetical protein